MFARRLFACVVILSFVLGCEKPASSAPPTGAHKANAASQPPGWPATKAQPKLQTMKLYVGAEVVTAELALTQVQIATGMMFRKEMAEMEGMLFAFSRPHRTAFYMKNTLLPLHIAYIGEDGTILELHELQALDETPVEAKTDQVQFVLEMNKGWFTRHNVAVGSVVTSEYGKLKDAFKLRP